MIMELTPSLYSELDLMRYISQNFLIDFSDDFIDIILVFVSVTFKFLFLLIVKTKREKYA